MCRAYSPRMTRNVTGTPPGVERPEDPTRAARWADALSEHWHGYEPTAETQARAESVQRARNLKPTHIASRPPEPH